MSEEAFVISNDYEFPVVLLRNYCNDETLKDLSDTVCDLCDKDQIKIVFDLSGCKLINSLGIGELFDAVLTIDQDYAGFSVVTGLNAVQERVFGLTGIFRIAQSAPDIQNGIELLKAL